MPPKTIKKASSAKRKSLTRARTAGTTSRSGLVPPAEEELFAKAFRLSPHLIGITELETGRCLGVNDACLEIFGFQRHEVIEKTTLMLGIWPDPQERVRLIDRLKSEGKVRNLEVSLRTKNGDLRRFLISTDLITLRGRRCLLTIGNDITELKQATEEMRRLNETLEQRIMNRAAELEESNERLQAEITERKQAESVLRRSEEQFRTVVESAPNGILLVDGGGRIVLVNEQIERQFGYRREELINHPVERLLPGHFRRDHAGLRETYQEAPAARAMGRGRDLYGLRKDGSELPLEIGLSPIETTSGTMVLASVVDITERKQAEEALHQKQLELQQSQAQLEDLASKLLTAQDSERQRIARDLHDDFSQRLVALTLDLAALDRQPSLSPESLGKALEPVREELAQLSDDLRRLAHRLHPSLLKHAGLRAALEEHIQQAMKRTELRITLKVGNVPESLPLDSATCLFRVCQESLQNVVKHANATDVLVKLSGSAKGIGLSVTDNGKGFDVHNKRNHQKGLGLISMQERLRLVKGFLNIHSRPADGTKVCAWIPFQENRP
ncbi:MAG: PAS domain S-box protein [Nitrospira sp.]|nr:PAS domain S-box protein [Nitrospira sp.]